MAEPLTAEAILRTCKSNLRMYMKHKIVSDIKNVKLDTFCIMKRRIFTSSNFFGKLMRVTYCR